jgi:ABC-type antimicrobial peptide transport system permease subunit
MKPPLVLVSGPVFAAAAWLPSFIAAQYDPAEILRND